MGFYFSLGGEWSWYLTNGERLVTNIVKGYAVCECKDGMYNGNATHRHWAEFQDGELYSVEEQTGEISNGVRDGKWYIVCSNSLDSICTYLVSVYEKGIPQVFGQDEAGRELTQVLCDENGNPIKSGNGDYTGGVWTTGNNTHGLAYAYITDGYILPY